MYLSIKSVVICEIPAEDVYDYNQRECTFELQNARSIEEVEAWIKYVKVLSKDNKVLAIKRTRDTYSTGLREAKLFVEQIMKEAGE